MGAFGVIQLSQKESKMSLAEILDYTYDDYKEWEGDWELIGGTAVAMAPTPMRRHQNIALEILYQLRRAYETLESKCENCVVSFENDWKVSDTTVLRPDIIFTCDDEEERYLSKAPKIIFEIVSPSTARIDETIKFEIYEQEKVPYYILVYPEDLRAKAYRLKNGRYDKIGDFTREKLEFGDLECPLSIDFDEVFRRFRKK